MTEEQNHDNPETTPTQPAEVWVTVPKIRPIDNHGAWVASATVQIGEITIHDVKLFMKGKSFWIAGPSREYTTKEGEKKYQPVVEFAKATPQGGNGWLASRVRAAVKDAYLALTEPEGLEPTPSSIPGVATATDDDGKLPF